MRNRVIGAISSSVQWGLSRPPVVILSAAKNLFLAQLGMTNYYTYILASRSRVLYVGITNNLERRVAEHKTGEIPGFTKQYRVNQLVWFEEFPTATQAIEAEKRIKGWTREKKIALINQ